MNSPRFCPPLPPPTGTAVHVSTVAALVAAVNNAASGTTILMADGTYALDGQYLRFEVLGVTLRSASGNREAVVLDGNYLTTEIIQITASGVAIADLTLREAYYHPIHVMSVPGSHTLNTLIYNVRIIDPGEQAVKLNPYASEAAYFTDNGTVACSHIELTDTGRPHIRNNCYTGGIDAHQSRGWTIRDNLVTHTLRERDGASALQQNNLSGQPLTLFAGNGAGGDLHLKSNAAAAINKVPMPADTPEDIDGDRRPVSWPISGPMSGLFWRSPRSAG